MNSSEKRAELGDDWPACDCHGEPLRWHTNDKLRAGGRFYCGVHYDQRRRAWRNRRLERGECIHCGGSPLTTDTMCRDCADAHIDVMAQPKQRMDHRQRMADKRRDARNQQGYVATGVGLAAFAAWKEDTSG